MAVTKYTWDPVTDSILEETDGAGNVLATYTNEPSDYGPLLSQRRGGVTRHFHFDALGSTRQLTDDAGTVTDTFTYDAWGNEVARSGSGETPFRWVGQLGYKAGSVTNILNIRYRSYSMSDGRWNTADPISDWTVFTYNYADNSPTFAYDPSGEITATTRSSNYPRNGTLRGPCPVQQERLIAQAKAQFGTSREEMAMVRRRWPRPEVLSYVQLVHINVNVSLGECPVDKCRCPMPCECDAHNLAYEAVR